MDQRLSIVTLGVGDLARAKEFYLDGLGWVEVGQPSAEVCFIQLPSIVLGLYGWADLAADMAIDLENPEQGQGVQNRSAFRGFSLAYNTLSEQETDEVLAAAVAAGATLMKAAESVFWGGYSGYFADPDGHAWEVAFNPFTLPRSDGSFVMTP